MGLCHGIVKPGMGVFSAPLALSRADRRAQPSNQTVECKDSALEMRRPLGVCSTEGREAVRAALRSSDFLNIVCWAFHSLGGKCKLQVTRYRVLGYFHGAWGSYSLLQVQQQQLHPSTPAYVLWSGSDRTWTAAPDPPLGTVLAMGSRMPQ